MDNTKDEKTYYEYLNKFDDDIINYATNLNIIDDQQLLIEICNKAKKDLAALLSKTVESDINKEMLLKLKNKRMARKKKVLREDKTATKSRCYIVLSSYNNIDNKKKVEKIENELKEWAGNLDKELCSYMFYEYKTIRFKKTSLLLDCTIAYFSLFLTHGPNKPVQERALSMALNFPISTTKRTDKLKDENSDKLAFNYDEENMNCIFEISKEEIMSGEYSDILSKIAFSILDKDDIKILSFLIKYGSETFDDFFGNRKVQVDVNTVAYGVYGTITPYIRKKIRNSILKMSYMTITLCSNNKDSNTVIINRPLESGKYLDRKETNYDYDMIFATICEEYIQDIIDRNVVTIYSHVLEQLKDNEDAKEAIFKLQKERICYYYKNRNLEIVEQYVKEMSYKHFRRYIIMNNKKKDQLKKRINKFLDAIIATDEILDDYKVMGDMYKLYFKPFSEEEKIDLNKRTDENIKRFL